jgi:hypothetical protein
MVLRSFQIAVCTVRLSHVMSRVEPDVQPDESRLSLDQDRRGVTIWLLMRWRWWPPLRNLTKAVIQVSLDRQGARE